MCFNLVQAKASLTSVGLDCELKCRPERSLKARTYFKACNCSPHMDREATLPWTGRYMSGNPMLQGFCSSPVGRTVFPHLNATGFWGIGRRARDSPFTKALQCWSQPRQDRLTGCADAPAGAYKLHKQGVLLFHSPARSRVRKDFSPMSVAWTLESSSSAGCDPLPRIF